MVKYIRKISIFLLILFFVNIGFGQQTTLIDCFKAAEQNHPALQKDVEIERINSLKLKNINSSWYPAVDLKGKVTNQSDVTSIDIDLSKLVPKQQQNQPGAVPELPNPKPTHYDAALEISQKIYDFGATSSQKKLIETKYEEELANIAVNYQQIKLQISKIYLQILVLKKHREILQSMIGDIEATLRIVSSGVENGILLPSDKYELVAKKLETEQNIADIEHSISSLIANLIESTGLKIDGNSLVTPDIEFDSSNQIMRPENKLFEIKRTILQQNRQLKYRQNLPKIGGFAKVGYGRPGLNMLSGEFDGYYIAGIQLSWNIWDWKRNKRERQILKINKEIIQKSERSFNKNVKTGLNREQQNISKFQDMARSDQDIIKLRKKILKEYRSKLRNGTITSADYVKKLNSLSRARFNYENHKIKLTNAKINYQLLRGEL